ncbi:alpha/beta fold hydrolase [Streptomyces sp. 35G-GA-8]|uniref:alpha/beta fold hydrolase n=1 Tax=Streptomyces sp. 35G-GA-8 TaxID=2939434 RepID=UPI00201F4865|nr:alpha/beta hydrolase [Streptomyces sp. 35G-GA-8]MCL7378470.1 alpha/beta hydrolase [Streptomyces sp. 35G-GA-8]
MPIDAVLAQEQDSPMVPQLIPEQPAEEGGPDGPVDERDLTFDGFRYTCRIVDHGTALTEPLLVLGGSSQDRHSWVRHEKWLAPLGQVITVDLPGYGTADFLPAHYGVDFLAATIRHLLTELDVPRVNLVAACYGGAVGLRFAQHYPGMLARLLLVGMTTRIPADYAAAMERWSVMIDRGETETIARELADRFMSPPGTGRVRKHAAVSRLVYQQIAGQDPEQLKKSAEHNTRLMRHEWYRPEPVPAVPSLVVTGEHDTLCTPAMGREVAAQLPEARFLTIDETDHLAPVERIADFADLMARFCTDLPIDELPYASRPETLGTAVGATGAAGRRASATS